MPRGDLIGRVLGLSGLDGTAYGIGCTSCEVGSGVVCGIGCVYGIGFGIVVDCGIGSGGNSGNFSALAIVSNLFEVVSFSSEYTP